MSSTAPITHTETKLSSNAILLSDIVPQDVYSNIINETELKDEKQILLKLKETYPEAKLMLVFQQDEKTIHQECIPIFTSSVLSSNTLKFALLKSIKENKIEVNETNVVCTCILNLQKLHGYNENYREQRIGNICKILKMPYTVCCYKNDIPFPLKSVPLEKQIAKNMLPLLEVVNEINGGDAKCTGSNGNQVSVSNKYFMSAVCDAGYLRCVNMMHLMSAKLSLLIRSAKPCDYKLVLNGDCASDNLVDGDAMF